MSYNTTDSENATLLNTGTPIPDLSNNNNKKRYGLIGAMLALLAFASFSMGRSSGLRAGTNEMLDSMYLLETPSPFTTDERNQLYAGCGGYRTGCIQMKYSQFNDSQDFDYQLLTLKIMCDTDGFSRCRNALNSVMDPRTPA